MWDPPPKCGKVDNHTAGDLLRTHPPPYWPPSPFPPPSKGSGGEEGSFPQVWKTPFKKPALGEAVSAIQFPWPCCSAIGGSHAQPKISSAHRVPGCYGRYSELGTSGRLFHGYGLGKSLTLDPCQPILYGWYVELMRVRYVGRPPSRQGRGGFFCRVLRDGGGWRNPLGAILAA